MACKRNFSLSYTVSFVRIRQYTQGLGNMSLFRENNGIEDMFFGPRQVATSRGIRFPCLMIGFLTEKSRSALGTNNIHYKTIMVELFCTIKTF